MKNALIKASLVLALFSGSLNAVAANWRAFAENSDTIIAYDEQSIYRKGNIASAQIVYDLKNGQTDRTADGIEFSSFTQRLDYQCGKRLSRLGEVAYYLNGKVVYHNAKIGKWEKHIKDTPLDMLYERLCPQSKKR